MSQNLIVAVSGGKWAGKTTFCATLSLGLTKYFWNVFLVNGDRFLPAHDMWGIQNEVKEGFPVESIGNILSYPDLTEDYIKQRVIYLPVNKIYHPGNDKVKIGLMGYLVDDDCELYQPISGNAAQSFLNEVKKCFQITIVDCTLPQMDSLTEKALMCADIVITLLEPNCVGFGIFYAQRSFKKNHLPKDRLNITIASKVDDNNAVGAFEETVGIRFDKRRLPFTQEAREKLNSLNLFSEYKGEYGDTVADIAKRIMEVAAE
jgi:hypothetical protein